MTAPYTPTCEGRHVWTEESGERCVCGELEAAEATMRLPDGSERRVAVGRRIAKRA